MASLLAAGEWLADAADPDPEGDPEVLAETLRCNPGTMDDTAIEDAPALV